MTLTNIYIESYYIMKKFLLLICITLLSLGGTKAQTVVQQEWTVENAEFWGSFYWSVNRSQYADVNGKYWYYVYAYSNSLFNTKSDGYNYDRAITFVRNVKINMYEYKYENGYKIKYGTVNVKLSHFTCDYYLDPNHYIAYFWSYSKYNTFSLTFDKATAYDKSYYNGR